MDNLLTLALEAHNAEKNHHRRYQVTLGRDLLDHWTVAIRYGRTGQAGRELHLRCGGSRRASPHHPRAIGSSPLRSEAHWVPLSPGGIQHGARVRCLGLAARRSTVSVLCDALRPRARRACVGTKRRYKKVLYKS